MELGSSRSSGRVPAGPASISGGGDGSGGASVPGASAGAAVCRPPLSRPGKPRVGGL